MSMFKKVKNLKTKSLISLAMVFTSASASAAGTPSEQITASINSAIAAGQSNYTLIVIGVLGLAAIGFGVGMMTSGMRR